MAEYDSNMIKPVNGLKNIAGLNSVKHREERKRRQQLHHEGEEEDENTQGKDSPPQEQAGKEVDINSDSIGIDYCA
jgi:hypothetical protein